MPKASEKTIRELEEILNESETYADRLTAFLKQKTAPPESQCNEPFAIDDLDLSFDLDVNLVKLPAKPVPTAVNKAEESKESALREITNQSVLNEDSKAIEPQTVPNSQKNSKSVASPVNITSPSNVNTSPRRSAVRRSGYHVPGSDRLRRVAIHRRSHSCGRRDLLKEFNELLTCNVDFRPPVSSTPDSEQKSSEKTTQTLEKASEPVCAKTPTPHPTPKKNLPDDLLSQASSMPLHSTTSDASTKRRTYTIEMGPEPGQLLLSPSRKGNPYSLRQRLSHLSPSNYNTSPRQANLEQTRHQANLSAARLQILAQDTPVGSYSPIQPMPDFIVPETQPMSQIQTGNQMIQQFADNAVVAPLMVVPMASVLTLSTKAESTPTRPTQVDAAAQVKVSAAPTVTSRSMQTSNSLRRVQSVNDIMTDDDSSDEKEVSTAPLNLAPPGSNVNRKRNLHIRVKRMDKSTELLDLHRSCCKTSNKRDKSKQRQTVLNKPSQPAINGEQFAYELARMSNYEILDLRKRTSMGRQCPINGHREQLTEQELLMEQHIEWEILRRNLDEPNERTATTIPIKDTTIFASSLAAPPQDYRDVSMPKQREDSKTTQQRRTRASRRDSVMMRSLSPPLPPPAPFGDYSMQTRQQRKTVEQKSTQRGRSRPYEQTMGEYDLLTVCTPPSQFRKSMSRQQKNHSQHQQEDHTLPAPPLEFNNMPETGTEEEIQESEIELLPPVQFFELEEIDSSVQRRPASQLPLLEQIDTDHAQMSNRIETRIQEGERLENEIGKNNLEARQQKELQENQQEDNLQKEISMQKERDKQIQSEKQEKKSRRSQRLEQCSHGKNQRKSQQQVQQKSQQQLQLESGHEQSLKEKDQQKEKKNQRESQQQEIRQQDESIQEEQLPEKKNQSNIRNPQRKSQQQEQQTDGHQQLQGGKQKESIPEKEQLGQEKEQHKKGKKQRKSHKQEKRQQEVSMLEEKQLHPKKDDPKMRETQVYLQELEDQTDGHQRSDSVHEPEKAPPPPAPSDHVFKKPTAPAPRAKQKTQLERQLQKLHINLANKTVVPEDEGEIDANTTVRRSRRGQVPLCNTWVHTQTDPFNFMRKIIEPKATTSKRNKRAESSSAGSSVKNKGPLSSSTPRTTPALNGKRKRPPQNIEQVDGLCDVDALSGISRLSDISEGEEMEQTPRNRKGNLQISEKSNDAVEESKKSKTGKKKKQASIAVPQTPETEVDSATDFLPTDSPNTIQPEHQPSESLLSWLCGEREVPTDGNDASELRNEAMTVSRASNLQFSNVDGIEYAFYQTEDLYSMGYMRFQPLQQRGMKLARTNTLRFVTLHGQFDVTILNQQTKQKYEGILHTGDVIEVKRGNRYNISNRLNQVGIIMVYRNAE